MSLCRAGESLFVIDVRNGRVTLTPTASWTVHGSDDPGSWKYRLTLSGPDHFDPDVHTARRVCSSRQVCAASVNALGRKITG